jgi:hypothetical protein
MDKKIIIAGLLETADELDNELFMDEAIELTKIAQRLAQMPEYKNGSGGSPYSQEPEYGSDPSDIASKPVAMDIDVNSYDKLQNFGGGSGPEKIKTQQGQQLLFVHGAPDGWFYIGTDNKVQNNKGWVQAEGLDAWLKENGMQGKVQVVSCYNGKMEAHSTSGGSVNSLFKNPGKIGFSTQKDQEGNNRVIFEQ